MDLNTYTYFLIILSGFGLVWSYRKAGLSRREISDFEYLGFSAFWGVLLLALTQWAYKEQPEKFQELLQQPYIAGVCIFVVGVIFGTLAAWIRRWIGSKLRG